MAVPQAQDGSGEDPAGGRSTARREHQWRCPHCNLLIQLIKRDVLTRYRGAMFGVFWISLSPLLGLAEGRQTNGVLQSSARRPAEPTAKATT